ncbi:MULTISPECIES: aminotransferase class I/II-fold pyridoxal phosphate-dependent enzyme [Exiguobacterium]|uniref:aminotransferase class I/II-fold pyridoxal phosphate-dependent enzyme n=1 Tax=Exiguobacterium TaxID=33986 RepID=UPI000AD4AF1B|nr:MULTISPECIES: aminotransferase class I/II-fold pyridoxal phosphate-dependent enzyme [Exiguobacterium]MCT4781113.1 aminotransferase class I/II-fold pyridoxal phosphate-dependent enzyme [Exiguobacterium soli]
MKGRMPIVEALYAHVKRKATSWHVPGHKNGTLLKDLPSFLEWDKTELSGLDDFHHPEEAIYEAKLLLRQIYDASDSHFLVNGSTVGNWGMLAAVASRGDRIYVQRNSHKSVFNALEWLGLSPILMEPEYHHTTGISGNVSRETLEEALKLYPGGTAVFLTSPTYYGETAQIKELVQLTKSHNLPLLVDEAHGAHFGEAFGISSAFELGATAVVQSAHKTLPALTMAAWIHERFTNNERRKLKHALQAFQTSSPSYLLMASLDFARNHRQQWTGQQMAEVRFSHELFHQQINQLDGLKAFTFEDWSRMILSHSNHSGKELLDALEKQGLDAEFALGDHVVCILPLRILPKLEREVWIIQIKTALDTMKAKGIPDKRYIGQPIMGKIKVSSLACPLDQLECFEGVEQSFEEAVGSIALETIIPYPPGVPLILRGERVTLEHITLIEQYITASIHLQGGELLHEGKLRVIQEGIME